MYTNHLAIRSQPHITFHAIRTLLPTQLKGRHCILGCMRRSTTVRDYFRRHTHSNKLCPTRLKIDLKPSIRTAEPNTM